MFLRCVYLVMMITSISANAQSKVARQDRYEIKQLMVPGFENLPLERKMFVYYLSEALEASRDIAWQQLSRHGLELRQLFEKIWPRIGELDAPVRQSLESYYFELIHNHGPHDGNTNEKRVMTGILPEQFVTAVVSLGAEKETAKRLLPDIFDPQLDRYRVAPAGSDKIATSGTAFYGEGMTTVLLEKLSAAEQRHFLSTPVVENEDHVRLLLHKQDGRFSSELSKAAFYLKLAKKYASPVEQELIDAHLRTIASGDPADLERAERIWVQHKPEDITFVLGFVETYDDPLEARGTWEGFILLKNTNPEAARRNQIIREHAADFEQRMPVDEEFKKKGAFTPPDSEGAFMVRFAGGSSERSFKGVNLPNSAAIREELGSHSFTAYNKVNDLGDAGEAFTAQALNEYYLPSYHELLKRYGAAMPFTLLVEFHEMLGHGSGRDRSGVVSSDALGSDYSAMEESRADIAAIYNFTDPDYLHELGIIDQKLSREAAGDFANSAILQFFTTHLESYTRLEGRTEIRQAHQLGRQMITNRALNDGAIMIEVSEHGVPQVALGSRSALRESFGKYWADVQRLKSTGDAAGLRAFIERWGVMSAEQQQWALALGEAKKRLNEASYMVYLNPRFELVKDQDGRPTDVQIHYERPSQNIDLLFQREQQRLKDDQRRECEIALGTV